MKNILGNAGGAVDSWFLNKKMNTAGFEPTTSTSGGWRSIQLSYVSIGVKHSGFHRSVSILSGIIK